MTLEARSVTIAGRLDGIAFELEPGTITAICGPNGAGKSSLVEALAGALLVLVADMVCRILPLVTELRLGIALSLIGAPFFLHLLLRMRRGLA